jgi:hypothetical protein
MLVVHLSALALGKVVVQITISLNFKCLNTKLVPLFCRYSGAFVILTTRSFRYKVNGKGHCYIRVAVGYPFLRNLHVGSRYARAVGKVECKV